MRKNPFWPAGSRRLHLAAFFIALVALLAGCNKKQVADLADESPGSPPLPSPVQRIMTTIREQDRQRPFLEKLTKKDGDFCGNMPRSWCSRRQPMDNLRMPLIP